MMKELTSPIMANVLVSDLDENESRMFDLFFPFTFKDVFAPGLNILSIWKGGRYATNTISGTSMASPHVAGLAAYFLSLEDGPVEPKHIKDKILRLATRDVLDKIPEDTPNLLIFNDSGEKDLKQQITESVDGLLKDLLGDY